MPLKESGEKESNLPGTTKSLDFCLWPSAVRARCTDNAGNLSRATASGIKKLNYLKMDAEAT